MPPPPGGQPRDAEMLVNPVERPALAQGFGMRPKVIFWTGWPVAVFMIVAVMPMARR
jgi:hypothetical protein